MRKLRVYLVPLAALVVLATAWPAAAVDSIKRGSRTLNGAITAMSATEVKIKPDNKDEETVPVNEIVWLRFDREPTQLRQVRTYVEAGRFDDAIDALGRVNVEELSGDEMRLALIKQDLEFFKALATARLAQGGSGSLKDAATLMNDFVKGYPDNFHYLEANEVLGDLALASDEFDDAVTFYARVEDKAPWPDVKMRAGVAKGRTLLRQAKPDEALTVLEGVLAQGQGAQGDLVARQTMMATVGKAEALGAQGKPDDGVKLLDELIAAASGEEKELHALAYTALGNCHRKAGRKKEARTAFLHVHILFYVYPELHAEALANLVELWAELGDAARSQEAKQILQDRYGNTRWGKAS